MAREELPRPTWIALTGSIPPGAPEDGYARLIAAAHDAGVPSAVDTRGAPLARSLEAGPDLVKINAQRGRGAARRAGRRRAGRARGGPQDPRAGGRPGHAAVVTIGADGAVLVEPDGTAIHGRLYVKGRYPVGSGDSFLAGLLCGLHRGEEWQEAMGLALGAAAANAEVPGAGRFDPERARELAAANPGHLLLSE